MGDTTMTGKELILYILNNNLENEPVFQNGRFIGFLTEHEVAAEFGVGSATVRAWVNQNMISGAIRIENTVYIPATVIDEDSLLVKKYGLRGVKGNE